MFLAGGASFCIRIPRFRWLIPSLHSGFSPFGGIVGYIDTPHNGFTITQERTISPPASARGRVEGPILIVEDPIVQKFLHSVLKLRGYEAVSVGPYSALDFMKTSHPCVGLVITNSPSLFLPFADRVPVLYVAACPDRMLASRFRNCEVLQKPFHPSDLLKAIEVLSAVS